MSRKHKCQNQQNSLIFTHSYSRDISNCKDFSNHLKLNIYQFKSTTIFIVILKNDVEISGHKLHAQVFFAAILK